MQSDCGRCFLCGITAIIKNASFYKFTRFKRIAELLAIAPRSVLMLRHRFRQKIGMDTELSLEAFIEELMGEGKQ